MTQLHSTRRFRFGVLAEHSITPRALLETARRAEAAGYSTLLIRDHFIEQPFGHQLAPLTALASVAAATSTLRLGTLVLANDYRHPVLVAKEMATLDGLSGGRVELGLGAGYSVPEYQQAGLPFDAPRTRIDRLAESLQVVKGLWADEPCTFRGQHFTIDGLDGYPKPVQRPRPPILVAGGGRRILSLAAREADIVGLLSAPIVDGVITDDPASRLAESVDQRVSWIREAAGARFEQLELSIVASIVVTDDQQRAAAELAQQRSWQAVSPGQILSMPTQLIGSREQIVEGLLARRERYDISYIVVSDSQLDIAAPILARLIAT
jgi:probable F420-dependent oxidoreductase